MLDTGRMLAQRHIGHRGKEGLLYISIGISALQVVSFRLFSLT